MLHLLSDFGVFFLGHLLYLFVLGLEVFDGVYLFHDHDFNLLPLPSVEGIPKPRIEQSDHLLAQAFLFTHAYSVGFLPPLIESHPDFALAHVHHCLRGSLSILDAR